jgi:quinoprotein relay system zinc metallohydrolase 2
VASESEYGNIPARIKDALRRKAPAAGLRDSGGATRRQALFGGFCLCCLPRAANAASADPCGVEEVAEGIFVRRGADEDATQANADAIANIGFIVGRGGVLVTDPGGSFADGARLRAAIANTTSLPVKYVVMSHVHPDHVFGAAAFLPDNPVFAGHARLKEALEQRGKYYRGKLRELLGPEAAGTVILQQMEICNFAEIDLGDRIIEARAHGPAHTVSDLTLFDQKTGTLLPADLLFAGRVPSLDGSLFGWRKTLDELTQHRAGRAVPGHGPAAVDWPAGSAPRQRYLAVLERETREAIAAGVSIETAMKSVAASERTEWKLFDEYNARNVGEAYKELEWE